MAESTSSLDSANKGLKSALISKTVEGYKYLLKMAESTSLDSTNKVLKSALIFKTVEGYKYLVKISQTKTTAVNVLKKVTSGSKTASTWLLRFDNAHKNVNYPHLNVRHSLTGIKDPHLKLPPGTIIAVQGSAYAAKALNAICYTTMIYDGFQLGKSIYNDCRDGSTERTKECATTLTGTYLGGSIGCAVGSTVGGFLIPGVGPIIGGISITILGVNYGRDLAKFTVSKL